MVMKNKLIFLIPVIVLLGSLAVFKIWTQEDSWVCKDGRWTKHGNPSSPMPSKPCTKNGEIITAREADEPSTANPASKNCLDKGGKISFVEESEGTLGICKFSDGSECEEWKFFRGECQPGQQTAADTTHPYTGVISKKGESFVFTSESGVEYTLQAPENRDLKERLLTEASLKQRVVVLASETPALSRVLILKGFQEK